VREEGALYTDVDVTFDIVIDKDRCSSFKNVFVEAYLQKFTFFQREINFFRREECLLFRHNRSPRQLVEEFTYKINKCDITFMFLFTYISPSKIIVYT
jgi:hypothetical protein